MENKARQILQVAIQTPLRRTFDYLPPPTGKEDFFQPGIRVRVPFGKRETIGILLHTKPQTRIENHKLKSVLEILDDQPLFTPQSLQLLEFASDYYQYPIGEVLVGTLPRLLREGESTQTAPEYLYRLTEQGACANLNPIKHAVHQLKIIQLLKDNPCGLSRLQLQKRQIKANALTALLAKGYIKKYAVDSVQSHPVAMEKRNLNEDQQTAVTTIIRSKGFQTFLLEGVTGSGKTEVYLQSIEQIIRDGKQALILVPEIGLTPQTVARFQERFAVPIAVLHSGLNEKERLQFWIAARNGIARVIIGTRSAIFTPIPELGIIILDEEHDLSFKQQSGFRYSAKDLAIVRGKLESIPVVLGSATPCLETLHNVKQKRFHYLHLPDRIGAAVQPSFYIIDIRDKKLEHGLSSQLIKQIQKHLDQNGQILLFLNRRGYAPVLICHHCGWTANCSRCDARYTYHHHLEQLLCHHCGSTQKLYQTCVNCRGSQLLLLGLGTEKLEQTLKSYFPDVPTLRIDRDTTRRKGMMEKMLTSIHNQQSRILIGTQMIAKGHHFADVTLVAIIDIDHSLYSSDFRAPERMGQMIIQVAGRAGRAEKPGEVYIQTHNPQHPLLLQLIQQGYTTFANKLLRERKDASLPPYTYLALFRAESTNSDFPMQFLSEVKSLLNADTSIEMYGPIPALMERKAGKYRAQLLLQTKNRVSLQKLLQLKLTDIESLPSTRKVRWSLDIDPMESM